MHGVPSCLFDALLDAVRFRQTDLHGGFEPAAHRRRSEGFDDLKP